MANQIKRNVAYKFPINFIINAKPKFESNLFRGVFNEKIGTISRVNIIGNVVDKFVSEEKPYVNLTIDDGSGQIQVRGFFESSDILKDKEIGDTVKVIGMLRYFGNQLYVLAEICKKVSPKWLIARKLEIKRLYPTLFLEQEIGKEEEQKEEKKEEKKEGKEEEREEEIAIEKIEEETKKEEEKSEEQLGESEKKEKESEKSEKLNLQSLQFDEKKLALRETILNKIRESEPNGIEMEKLYSIDASQEEINKVINKLVEEGSIYESRPGVFRAI